VKNIIQLGALLSLCLISVFNCQLALASSLNNFQVIGSHNSYKRLMPKAVITYIETQDHHTAQAIKYSHNTLIEQLDLGLRHLEIDVLLDPLGAKFSQPKAEEIVLQSLLSDAERLQLELKGLKVLHIPDIDFLSHCPLFSQCLEQLLHWSQSHPKHFPITILLNVKESKAKFLAGELPIKFTESNYTELDNEINNVLPVNKLITPDLIRGDFKTLEQAVLTNGWPDIEDLKGRFLFVFDGSLNQRSIYSKGHPSLSGRVMFASFEPGQPEAAYLIMNDPIDEFNQIKKRVEQGYMVRTRADANLSANNTQRRERKEAAFNSGAHIISSDFYEKSPLALTSGYKVIFNQKKYIRNNPITTAQLIE